MSKLKNNILKSDIEVDRLKRQLSDLEQKDQKIKKKFFESDMDDDFSQWIREQVSEIKNEKLRIDERLKELDEAKLEMMRENGLDFKSAVQKEFATKFADAEGSQKRDVLEKLISRIVVKENGYLTIEWNTNLGSLKKGHKKWRERKDSYPNPVFPSFWPKFLKK